MPSQVELYNLEMKYKVGKDFQLIKEVGSGSYGEVCVAYHLKTGREVAIKKISNLFQIAQDAKRQLREVAILRLLKGHRNMVKLYDILEPEDPQNF